MLRCYVVGALLALIIHEGSAQIRMNALRLHQKEIYELKGSDIIVLDTLVMGDSSTLILNKGVADNFIHAKKMIVGKGATINGRGIPGESGKPGAKGIYSGSPCRDGSDGQSGSAGASAGNAVNVFLYVTDLTIKGTLIVDLTGGDGGPGGRGGAGGDGSPGTKLCAGGSGGAGGAGMAGGDGGNGGNFTITSPFGTELRPRVGDKIIVKSFGGFGGQGGEGGAGGQRGLGSMKDGATGRKGTNGSNGKAGKPGGIFFERK